MEIRINQMREALDNLESAYNDVLESNEGSYLDKLQNELYNCYDTYQSLHEEMQDFIDEEENKPCTASFELCAGRHKTPAKNGAIFENEVKNVKNLDKMYSIIKDKLDGYDEVIVYVTGLTVALVEVINFCQDYNIGLTLMHYDKETNSYYEQVAVERNEWI